MSAIIIAVDGNILATVSTDENSIVSVRVSGTKIDEIFATLEVNGGIYSEAGCSTFLIWVNDYPLTPLQKIEVSFLDSAQTSHQGKSIEELFHNAPKAEFHSNQPIHEIIEERRFCPRFRDNFMFNVRSSYGTEYSGTTSLSDHGFGFSVLWNWRRPERISASLYTYSFDDLAENRLPINQFHEYLKIGNSISIGFVA